LLARAAAAPQGAATRRRADELCPPRGRPGWRGRSLWAVVARRRPGGDGGAADGLASVLEEIARGVRAGSSLHQACADAATAGGSAAAGLATAVGHADRGQPLGTALARWAA